MAMATAFISLGLLAFCAVHVEWAIVPFLLLLPIGYGGSLVVRGSIVREYFGRDSYGKMIGVIIGSAAFGGIIGPTLAGWMYDTMGNYQPIWLLFCGLNGLATVLTLRLKRPSL